MFLMVPPKETYPQGLLDIVVWPIFLSIGFTHNSRLSKSPSIIEHTPKPMEILPIVHKTLNPLHKCLCMFHVCHKN